MLRETLLLIFVACCIGGNSFAEEYSKEKTSTGFYWPIGIADYDSACGSWMEQDGKEGRSGCYFPGKYHIGEDMMTNEDLNHPVYAIADGKIIGKHCSDESWGKGNCGLFIKHETLNGVIFTALYGHLRTSFKKGQSVEAGDVIGTTGPWSGGVHLHFGVFLGDKIPRTNKSNGIGWGMMSNSNWTNTNGFVDPIAFIQNNYPKQETMSLRVAGNVGWRPVNSTCLNAEEWYMIDKKKKKIIGSLPDELYCYSINLVKGDAGYESVFGENGMPLQCFVDDE